MVPTHGAYPDAVRLLAAREDLPLIDLSAASTKLVQEMGEPSSRELYMVFTPNLYPNYPDGKEDNTHLRYLGAVRFTGLVAAGLQALGGPYADVLLAPREDKYDGKGMRGKTSGNFAVVFELRLKLVVKRQSLSGFHQVQKLFLFYQINCPTSMVGIVCP